MPATTPNGMPYPLGSEPVADGDDAIKALATAIRYCIVTATVNLTATPTVGVAVTFPAGLFTATPVVVSALNSTGSTSWAPGALSVTTTGCSLFARSYSGSAGSGTAPVSAIALQV